MAMARREPYHRVLRWALEESGYDLYLAVGKHFTKEQLHGKSRIVAYGRDAMSVLKEMGIGIVAEIPEDTGNVEKIVMLKSILENPNKKEV